MAVKLINGDESSEAASRYFPPSLPAFSGGKLKSSVCTYSLWLVLFWKQILSCNTHHTYWDWISAAVHIGDARYLNIFICVHIHRRYKPMFVCVFMLILIHIFCVSVKQQFPYQSNSQRSKAFRQPEVGWWRLAEHASDSTWAGFSFKASHLPVS